MAKDLTKLYSRPGAEAFHVFEDDSGQVQVKMGNRTVVTAVPSGSGVEKQPLLNGKIKSGVWYAPPLVFKLRMVGAGVVIVESADGNGAVSQVGQYAPTGGELIDLPYLGDRSVAMRVTFPETVTVEVA